MDKQFSSCEVVELGIQIEKNGRDFYSILAKSSDNEEAAVIFEYLAKAEEDHIAVFREIFNSTCVYEPRDLYPEEYFAYMNVLANEHVFTRENMGREAAESVKDCGEGIEMGIKFEEYSILFYEEMKKSLSGKDADGVDKIIAEEKKHLEQLCQLKKGE